jgi:PAS domain S-box-containing protein
MQPINPIVPETVDMNIDDALRLLQDRAAQVLHAIDDGVVFLDNMGRTIFLNEAGGRMLGFTHREMLGKQLHDLTHHHYADGTPFPSEHCPITSSVTDAVQQRVGGDIFWTKNGTKLPVDYTSIPIKEGRTILGVVVTFRDITEQQFAETPTARLKGEREARAEAEAAREALRASEARYRFLAEAIPVQIWTAQPNGTLDYVSQRVADYFGTTVEQVLGEGWQNVIHPDDLGGVVARWTASLQSGAPYEVEFRLRSGEGGYRWYLGRALAQRDAEGRIVQWFGTNTDIEDQKRVR